MTPIDTDNHQPVREGKTAHQKAPLLEVIACTVADAIEAEQGGAGRLEIISHFEVGGLTPSVELVQEIIGVVSLPVRVILRESNGYCVSNEPEVRKLCAAARRFAQLGVDGLVMGFLRGAQIDFDLTARILDCAPGIGATFHHAFEELQNPLAAINGLKKLRQIDRILTWGGQGNLAQRRTRLASYQRGAWPEITIVAGGWMTAQQISLLYGETSIREFHVGRAARIPPRPGGAVQAGRVRELVRLFKQERHHNTSQED